MGSGLSLPLAFLPFIPCPTSFSLLAFSRLGPLSLWTVQTFTVRCLSQACPPGQRPMYQDFLSQYVLVCTLLPKGFAYLFSIHMVNKSVLGCFGCARNFMKIISWPFIHYSFKFSVIKRDFFFFWEMSDILTPFTFLYIGYFLLQLNPQL